MKLTDKALQHFELQEKSPGNLLFQQLMYDKGYCLLQLQRFEEAKSWFRKLIDSRHLSIPRRTRDLYSFVYELDVCNCLLGLGKYEEALKLLKSIEKDDLCQSFIGEESIGEFLLVKAECVFVLFSLEIYRQNNKNALR